MYKSALLTITVLLAAQINLQAQVNQTINHQGFLSDEAGQPVDDDSYIFTFRIYDDETAGNELWSENQVLQVANGVFNAQLGSEEPLDLAFDKQYWIGVEIDGEEELEPRMPLSASPYAMHALTVKDSSITADKIGDGAVTMAKLATTSDVQSVDIGLIENIGTSPENLGSITVNAPSSGSVLLFISGDAVFAGDHTTLKVGFGNTEASFDINDNYLGRLDGSNTERYRRTFNTITAVTINEGEHTFYATAEKSSTFDSNVINIGSLQLIAVYLPN